MNRAADALASGLSRRELADYVEQFGAAEEQVHRDHLISILLAALAASSDAEHLIFFGGTALSRTHLVDFRLSEDIDLLTHAPRGEVAPTGCSAQAATMTVGEGLRVQVQFLTADHYPAWPTETAAIEQRYTDVRPAQLRTLTLEAFVAAKTAAWIDRQAPRDLYDLYGLARHGAINATAADLFRRHGPTGNNPGPWAFDTAPSETSWRAALAHQCRLQVTAAEALEVVAGAWASVGT